MRLIVVFNVDEDWVSEELGYEWEGTIVEIIRKKVDEFATIETYSFVSEDSDNNL